MSSAGGLDMQAEAVRVLEPPSSAAKTRAGSPCLVNALRALVQALFREASSGHTRLKFEGHSWMEVTHKEHREQTRGSKPAPEQHSKWVKQMAWPSPVTRVEQSEVAQSDCWGRNMLNTGNR